jgi:2-dehydropantoate 2-reductase
MKIAAMGAGGVGGYFGARLQQAGHDVTFFARGRHLEAIRANGLKVESPHGDALLKVRVLEDPRAAGVADVVLFAVKLWDTESAAATIRPLLAAGGVVVPFQNGVDSIERIGAVLGREPVMGGAAYIAATIAEPGVIAHTGTMARLQFGAVLPAQRGAAEELLAVCKAAGIDAEIADDIRKTLWIKFGFLVALSGMTAATRQPIGVIRADPDLRATFEAAIREVWEVGRARGVALPDDFVAQQMRFGDGLPGEMRASMLNDLEAGHRLEAPWLSGAVARMAQEGGGAAPVNATLYAAVKPYCMGRQGPDSRR